MNSPYYLYTGGVLKRVEQPEPKEWAFHDRNPHNAERNNAAWLLAHNSWKAHVDCLPSIAVSDDLKAKWKEGDRPVVWKDFELRNGRMGVDGWYTAVPPTLSVNTLQEEKESQRDLWVEIFDHWAGEAPIEFIESKYHITRIKQQ